MRIVIECDFFKISCDVIFFYIKKCQNKLFRFKLKVFNVTMEDELIIKSTLLKYKTIKLNL